MKKTKVCTRCHKRKALNKFYNHPSSKYGVSSICKECRKFFEKENTKKLRKQLKKKGLLSQYSINFVELRKKVTKKFLIQKYIKENLLPKQIAKLLNCSFSVIYRYLEKFNIPRNQHTGKNHHLYIHGEASRAYYCVDCGKENSLGHKRCSKCVKKFQTGIHATGYRGGKPNCLICGKQLESYGIKYHQKCYWDYAHGENNPCWKGGKPKCKDCGIQLKNHDSTRCVKCRGKFFRGKRNPHYIHGLGDYPYTSEFNDELKLQIRERDNFQCQCCGIKENNHFRAKQKTNLTVHHINYNKKDCKPLNLITLCNKCNLKANTDVDYWFAYYTYLMENK